MSIGTLNINNSGFCRYNSRNNMEKPNVTANYSCKSLLQCQTGKITPNNISFTGLNKFFKTNFATGAAMIQAAKAKFFRSRGFVGNLPKSWIDLIPKAERPEKIAAVQDTFAEFAGKLYCERESLPDFEAPFREFSGKMTSILGITPEINYLGQGYIGKAYKLKMGGENYVFKVFHTDPYKFGYDSAHGKGIEPAVAPFVKAKTARGVFAKFYFGKVAGEQDADGFMVTKFIDENNAKKGNFFNNLSLYMIYLYSNLITCGEPFDKKVRNTILEYGAIRLNSASVLKNLKARKISRRLWKAVDNGSLKQIEELRKEFSRDGQLTPEAMQAFEHVKGQLQYSFSFGEYYQKDSFFSENQFKAVLSLGVDIKLNGSANRHFNHDRDKYKELKRFARELRKSKEPKKSAFKSALQRFKKLFD